MIHLFLNEETPSQKYFENYFILKWFFNCAIIKGHPGKKNWAFCLVIKHAELCISCFFTGPTTKMAEIGNVLSSQQFLHRFRNRNPLFKRFRQSFSVFTSKRILKLVRVSASLFRLVGVKYRPKSDDPGSMSL